MTKRPSLKEMADKLGLSKRQLELLKQWNNAERERFFNGPQVCAQCGHEHFGRSESLYCSNACRQKAYRFRKKMENPSAEEIANREAWADVYARCFESQLKAAARVIDEKVPKP